MDKYFKPGYRVIFEDGLHGIVIENGGNLILNKETGETNILTSIDKFSTHGYDQSLYYIDSKNSDTMRNKWSIKTIYTLKTNYSLEKDSNEPTSKMTIIWNRKVEE